jgi:hypothetical protein
MIPRESYLLVPSVRIRCDPGANAIPRRGQQISSQARKIRLTTRIADRLAGAPGGQIPAAHRLG